MGIIEIKNLSKKYLISHNRQKEKYRTLRDVLSDNFKNFIRRKDSNYSKEIFWALKDITLTIEQGDKIGIIGRNGAGKSTLLKILSRITEPSEGIAKIRGRVASLLEVGTGFHPELTGRENIFLNGSILGMRREEIKRKLKDIVDFSEIEKFLDTPVKRYSSGMYVRLAFAVAAHLDPEILLIDEVLAVGDIEFQKKCIGKMEEISSTGRTILYVSHNLSSVLRMCNKSVLLVNGKLDLFGDSKDVIEEYINKSSSNQSFKRSGNQKMLFDNFSVSGYNRQNKNSFFIFENIFINLSLIKMEDIKDVIIGINFYNSFDDLCLHIINKDDNFTIKWDGIDNTVQITIQLTNVSLPPGNYSISLWCGEDNYTPCDSLEKCLELEILQNLEIKRDNPYPKHAKNIVKSKWKIK